MCAEKNSVVQMDNFTLGRPALVCRWRLADRALPLENRHLRALGQRRVNDEPVPTQLVAWAKQHIEWTLADGAASHPDGVLLLIVDEAGRAAMSVGPYEPLPVTSTSALAERAYGASREAQVTGVAPETLWLVRQECLVWGIARGSKPSGASSLVYDLARTLGMTVVRDECLAERVISGDVSYDEVFLVSDEHGVAVSDGAAGPRSERLAGDYAKLLASGGHRR